MSGGGKMDGGSEFGYTSHRWGGHNGKERAYDDLRLFKFCEWSGSNRLEREANPVERSSWADPQAGCPFPIPGRANESLVVPHPGQSEWEPWFAVVRVCMRWSGFEAKVIRHRLARSCQTSIKQLFNF